MSVYKHSCANHRNKRPSVSTSDEALVGTLMTVRDVNYIFPIQQRKQMRHSFGFLLMLTRLVVLISV